MDPKRFPVEIPAYGIFALVVLQMVLRYVVPAPVAASGTEHLSQEMKALTAAVSQLHDSVRSLNELEERRMQAVQLNYPPGEWKALMAQVRDVHREVVDRPRR